MRRAAALQERIEEDDPVVGELVQPVAVEHHAHLQGRNPVADLQDLVELFVVLHDDEPAARMAQQVFDLRSAVGGIDAGDDPADALDADIGVDPLLPVFGEDGHDLASLQPEVDETHADGAGGVVKVGPRVAAPDAEHLLAMGRARSHLAAPEKEEFWQGVAAVDQAGPLFRHDFPEFRSTHVRYPQDLRRFQRRSPRRPRCSAPR